MRESVGTQQTSPTMKHSYGKSAAPGISRSKRRGTSTVPIADNLKVQYDIGGADAALLAARAFLLDVLGDAWTTVTSGAALSSEQATRIALAGQQTMNVAVTAVD